MPAEKINEAYDRVLASDVLHRFVRDTSTLGTSTHDTSTPGTTS